MLSKSLIATGGVAIVIVVMVALSAAPVSASHIDFEQRRIEREAQRAARDAERAAERAEREAQREARRMEREADREQTEEPACRCSARLSLAAPQLQFMNGLLHFVPRFDVRISSRGEFDAPGVSANLTYSGSTAYVSDDVTVPGGVTFSGNKQVLNDAMCGGDYRLDGLQAGSPVPLSGLMSALLGADQELEGTVRMEAALTGCGETEIKKGQASFQLEEFGNLKARNWRSVR